MESAKKPKICWTLLTHKEWRLHIAATSEGLCYVGSQDAGFEEMNNWAQSRFPGSPLVQDAEALRPYEAELTAYLQGKRESLTLPVDFSGTPFQAAVWQALRSIPYGQTRS